MKTISHFFLYTLYIIDIIYICEINDIIYISKISETIGMTDMIVINGIICCCLV